MTTGYRASKIKGATVYNQSRNKIGIVDDLIAGPASASPYLTVSIGGAPGLKTPLVAVPFSSIQIVDKQMLMPDATNEFMKALPEFKYAPDRHGNRSG